MKRSALLLLTMLLTAVCAAAEISRLDAEAGVRKDLLAKGVSIGSDETGDAYTVVASAERVCRDAAAACAVRTICFRMAELRARHQIMNARGMTASGRTSVRGGQEATARTKTVDTLIETFARQTLLGCELVGYREGMAGERYVVALALRWRRNLERAEQASAAGALMSAEDWRDAFRRRYGAGKGELLPPTGVFVDARGFVHRYGVGFADVTRANPQARSAAASFADLFARKNLQLALCGDAEMRKVAAAALAKGNFRSTASVYEALGTVTASGAFPPGARSVLECLVAHPVTGRSVYMVVYGL